MLRLLFVFCFPILLASLSSMAQGLAPFIKPFGKTKLLADLRLFKQIHEQANSGVYLYHPKKQVDSVFNAAALSLSDKSSMADFYRIIIKNINAYLGSAQNGATPADKYMEQVYAQASLFPISLKMVEGQMVVNEGGYEVPFGSAIISINGRSVQAMLRDLAKYTPADGYNKSGSVLAVNKLFGLNYFWEYGSFKEFTVEFAMPVNKNFAMKTVKATDYGSYMRHPHRLKNDLPYNFRILNPSTAELRLNSFAVGKEGSPGFADYKKLLDTAFIFLKLHPRIENLVVDVRENNGGSSEAMVAALRYLADTAFKSFREKRAAFQKIPFTKYLSWLEAGGDSARNAEITADLQSYFKERYEKTDEGTFREKESYNPWIPPEKNAFKGNIYLLVNPSVSSTGAQFAAILRTKNNAFFIGEETIGAYHGQNEEEPLFYVLPNTKMNVWFFSVYVHHAVTDKATQPKGRGVLPDMRVVQSYDDFLKQRDSELWFALKRIMEK